MIKESKIVDKINEEKFSLLDTKQFKTKISNLNFIFGALTGNFGAIERIDSRINNYAKKIKADAVTVEKENYTDHTYVNSESPIKKSFFYIGNAQFYKKKEKNYQELVKDFVTKTPGISL
jgi:hypothetical protein